MLFFATAFILFTEVVHVSCGRLGRRGVVPVVCPPCCLDECQGEPLEVGLYGRAFEGKPGISPMVGAWRTQLGCRLPPPCRQPPFLFYQPQQQQQPLLPVPLPCSQWLPQKQANLLLPPRMGRVAGCPGYGRGIWEEPSALGLRPSWRRKGPCPAWDDSLETKSKAFLPLRPNKFVPTEGCRPVASTPVESEPTESILKPPAETSGKPVVSPGDIFKVLSSAIDALLAQKWKSPAPPHRPTSRLILEDGGTFPNSTTPHYMIAGVFPEKEAIPPVSKRNWGNGPKEEPTRSTPCWAQPGWKMFNQRHESTTWTGSAFVTNLPDEGCSSYSPEPLLESDFFYHELNTTPGDRKEEDIMVLETRGSIRSSSRRKNEELDEVEGTAMAKELPETGPTSERLQSMLQTVLNGEAESEKELKRLSRLLGRVILRLASADDEGHGGGGGGTWSRARSSPLSLSVSSCSLQPSKKAPGKLLLSCLCEAPASATASAAAFLVPTPPQPPPGAPGLVLCPNCRQLISLVALPSPPAKGRSLVKAFTTLYELYKTATLESSFN